MESPESPEGAWPANTWMLAWWPWPWTCELLTVRWSICVLLSHQIYGNLLWQREETNIGAIQLGKIVRLTNLKGSGLWVMINPRSQYWGYREGWSKIDAKMCEFAKALSTTNRAAYTTEIYRLMALGTRIPRSRYWQAHAFSECVPGLSPSFSWAFGGNSEIQTTARG